MAVVMITRVHTWFDFHVEAGQLSAKEQAADIRLPLTIHVKKEASYRPSHYCIHVFADQSQQLEP